MKIDIYSTINKNIFTNNICIIVCIFCALCFLTADKLEHSIVKKQDYNISQNNMIGPVIVDSKSSIYKIEADFYGKNSSDYISVEVLDEDKDTLYEFGKDLWHEEGRDADGYWSEGDTKMKAHLSFSEKGKYYLLFNTEKNNISEILITIYKLKASYIPHLKMGMIFLIILLIFWLPKNWNWFKEGVETFCDKHFDESSAWVIGVIIFALIGFWLESL